MATLAAPQLQQEPGTNGLYERDFYSWTVQQAEALKRRDFNAIDWDNIIEEIEDLGSAQKRDCKTVCAHIIEHLLKIEYYREAADKVLNHWMAEIAIFRLTMADLVKENPGLKGHYRTLFPEAWSRGRNAAVIRLAEYDLDNAEREGKPIPKMSRAVRERDRMLPVECPYRLEDVTAFDSRRAGEPRNDIWPPSVARVLNTRLDEDFPVRRERSLSPGGGRQH